MSSDPRGWPKVARVAWLSGGAVAVSNPGVSALTVGAGLNGPVLGELTLSAFGSFFDVLKRAGLSVIGATFIQSADEAAGLVPAEFRALAATGGWQVWEAGQKWRQVAHGASEHDEMHLMDIASRIASGLRYSEMRLSQLAAAYSQQLRGCVAREKVTEYVRFKDGNSPPVYMAIHALFWELAVLRDSLAEFAAKYALFFDDIATMRGLVSRLRKATNIGPLRDELTAIADEELGGWVAVFTAYRNLFTHAAPMEQAAGVAFAVQDYRQLNTEVRLPCIYYPLPSDAKGIMQQRSKGALHSSFEAFIAASSGRKPDRSHEPDALDYLAYVVDRMGDLATRLLGHSPVTPTMIELTYKDLLGPMEIPQKGSG